MSRTDVRGAGGDPDLTLRTMTAAFLVTSPKKVARQKAGPHLIIFRITSGFRHRGLSPA
jgi:hypothetical protein